MTLTNIMGMWTIVGILALFMWYMGTHDKATTKLWCIKTIVVHLASGPAGWFFGGLMLIMIALLFIGKAFYKWGES